MTSTSEQATPQNGGVTEDTTDTEEVPTGWDPDERLVGEEAAELDAPISNEEGMASPWP